jgi:ATP synthase protein I
MTIANDPEEAPNGVEDPRLASLDERLRAVHDAEKARTAALQPPGVTGKGSAQGQRILSSLLGAPLGAALIGWVIDRFAGTTPIGLLVMLFLGFGAAISQVLRISKERAE